MKFSVITMFPEFFDSPLDVSLVGRARAAGIVMAGFVLSNLAGLARQILIADIFGTKGVIDAYYAAMGVPDMIFALAAGGALASAFIPTLTEFLAKDDPEGGWLRRSTE